MSSLTVRDVRPSGTRVEITAAELARLHAHAREGDPHEVVGILAGDRAGLRITRVAPLINEQAEGAERRYQVNGLMLMRAEQRLAAEGLEIVGYYHSHPDHPAMYSDTDRDLALPHTGYLIAAVRADGIAETRCWRLRDDRSEMDEDELVVVA